MGNDMQKTEKDVSVHVLLFYPPGHESTPCWQILVEDFSGTVVQLLFAAVDLS